ncbi:MAG: alpha/beta hydrolase [Solirubrobacteraceae bacterium]|nr:alpha/beta hydrolase [Solirubrobacteraceae bacterium]
MQPTEIEHAGRVAADAFAGGVTHVQALHRAIARRATGRTGWGRGLPRPVRDGFGAVSVGHDVIADGVYAAVRVTGAVALRGVGLGLAAARSDRALAAAPARLGDGARRDDDVPPGSGARPRARSTSAADPTAATPSTSATPSTAVARDPRPLRDHPVGGAVLGALEGAFGHRFTAEDGALALPMTVRRHGADLPLEPEALRRAFPLPSGRVAVLVHGLCMTDAGWSMRPRGLAPDAPAEQLDPYARRLKRDLGIDVVAIRYPSGRRIPANGAALANLLERLCAAWPGDVRELALIGHSLGGLVARSACAEGVAAGHHWPSRVRQVVLLGSPNLGANLERWASTASWLAGRLPETRVLRDLLELRSDAILDLRDGLLHHDDVPLAEEAWPWRARPGRSGGRVPLLPGVRHHAIAVTLGRDPDGWLSRSVLGDLLVTPTSATGASTCDRRLPLRDGDAVVLGGLDHFDLLSHPRAYEHLRTWLAAAPALPAAGGTLTGSVDGDAVELPGA